MVQLYKRMDFESINSCFQDEKNTPRRDLGMEIEQVIYIVFKQFSCRRVAELLSAVCTKILIPSPVHSIIGQAY